MPKIAERRNRKNNSKSRLIELLNDVKFDLEITTVQKLANDIENKIIGVVDTIAPISKFIEQSFKGEDLNERLFRGF